MNPDSFDTLPEPSKNYHVAPPPAAYNSLATVSLIFGIVSWLLLPIIGALVAIITGHTARAQIRSKGGNGDGLALAGLILGYLQLLFTILIIAVISIPIYGFYQEYRHSKTAFALLEKQRLNLMQTEYKAEQNVPLSDQHKPYWQSIDIREHVITAQFAGSENLPDHLRNAVVQIEAVTDDNGITVWHCSSAQLRSSLLPDYCENSAEDEDSDIPAAASQ